MTKDIEVTIQFTMCDIDINTSLIDKLDNFEDLGHLMDLVNNIILEEGVDNFIFNDDSRYEVIDAEIV